MKHKLILKTLVITLIAGMIAVPCSAMAAEIGTVRPSRQLPSRRQLRRQRNLPRQKPIRLMYRSPL